ncbi:MAG: GspE/PulE family protein [Candidatus Sericytochromatia bacterium]
MQTQRYQEWLVVCEQRRKAQDSQEAESGPSSAESETPSAPGASLWNESDVEHMEQRLLRAYQAYHLQNQNHAEAARDLPASERDPEVAPIIHLVHSLIEKAHLLGASDLHIEPGEEDVLIRCRIDGRLQVLHRLQPQGIIKPIITRLKIMAALDISEKRLPQDGKIPFALYNPAHPVNVRLSVVPLRFGEKAVLRLLDTERGLISLQQMGFEPAALQLYRQHIQSPYGMILHVGPTGSGKTTTLYGALKELNTPDRNIHTIENPIEYTLKGINQLEVRHDIGLDFARSLRAYLRQDPDVILVGEIRDAETAHVAVEAALTGHLLLSTLHTNDAASTLLRLLEMQIPPYLISSSLLLICAQRLLRKLCLHCRRPYTPNQAQHSLLQLPKDVSVTLYAAVGCSACHYMGYSGRIGIYELLIPNEHLRQLINHPQVTTEAIKEAAVKETQMRTLFQEGVSKALAGLTSAEEVTLKLLPDLKYA